MVEPLACTFRATLVNVLPLDKAKKGDPCSILSISTLRDLAN